jgi:hypothetical protein
MTIVLVVVALVGVGMLAVAPFLLLALREQTDDWGELSVVFSGDEGRRFWTGSRAMRAVAADTRRERRFHQILDEEYRRAVAARESSG